MWKECDQCCCRSEGVQTFGGGVNSLTGSNNLEGSALGFRAGIENLLLA